MHLNCKKDKKGKQKMEEGLFYSENALLNRVLFLSGTNELNIFVEDENKEYEYENIFNRLFSNNLKINNIFPMKGKKGVRKAFEEYGDSFENIPAIYLVDGDFDVIMEKEMINHPNYIYLEKYNIESYYIDKGATLRFVSGKMKKRQKDIVDVVDYDIWKTRTYKLLKDLFINYIIAQIAFPEEKNVGISPHKYLSNVNGEIDQKAIYAYIDQLSKRVVNYNELYNIYNTRYLECLEGDATRLICGKYVIACLTTYLRKKINITFKEEDFRYYLVGEFDIKKLNFLKRRVLNIMIQSKQS